MQTGELSVEPAIGPTCGNFQAFARGQALRITGDGFAGNATVAVSAQFSDGSEHSFGTVTAQGDGTLDENITLPAGSPGAGYYGGLEASGAAANGDDRLLTALFAMLDSVDGDSDGDGVPAQCDLCPSDSDPLNLDTDGDGLGDVCDTCPNDPENDLDGDGLCGNLDVCPHDPLNDADGDGICGDVDNCPSVYNPDQADTDFDTIGDACDPVNNLPLFKDGFESGNTSAWSATVP